jgi:flagella basal body P-ring formation protein FlgA
MVDYDYDYDPHHEREHGRGVARLLLVVGVGVGQAAFADAPAPLAEPTIAIPVDTTQPAAAADQGDVDGEEPETPAAASADLPVAPEVPAAATFTFKAALTTSRPRIFLGELATCTGSPEVCDEAYGVDLGASPEPGRAVFFRPDALTQLLAKEWPGLELTVAAPKAIKVTALDAPLDEDAVLIELKNELGDLFPEGAPFTVTVDKLSLTSPLKLRPGDVRVTFPELTQEHAQSPEWVRRNLAGSQRLAATCVEPAASDEDAETAPATSPPLTFTVNAQLTLKERLPVPAHSLPKGAILAAADLTDAWIDVGRASVHPIGDRGEVIGRRLRRPAPAFQPFATSQLEIPQLIRRGQQVRLVMRTGALDVSGRVVALESAGSGQVIDAVYPATKKKLRVRVVDASTVEFVF